MTKRDSVLQKKVHELEAVLSNIFSCPVDEKNDQKQPIPLIRQLIIISNDFEQRLSFAKSLLSAEITSHPSKPHHLDHMAHRLDQLDAAFREYWEGFKTTSFDDHHKHLDNASTCSCTESCLNDDVEDEEAYAELEGFEKEEEDKLAVVEFVGGGNRGLVDDEKTASFLQFSECLVDEKTGNDEAAMISVDNNVKKGRDIGWFFSGAVATGIVLGMALMGFFMVTFSGCFQYGEQNYNESLLTPT